MNGVMCSMDAIKQLPPGSNREVAEKNTTSALKLANDAPINLPCFQFRVLDRDVK